MVSICQLQAFVCVCQWVIIIIITNIYSCLFFDLPMGFLFLFGKFVFGITFGQKQKDGDKLTSELTKRKIVSFSLFWCNSHFHHISHKHLIKNYYFLGTFHKLPDDDQQQQMVSSIIRYNLTHSNCVCVCIYKYICLGFKISQTCQKLPNQTMNRNNNNNRKNCQNIFKSFLHSFKMQKNRFFFSLSSITCVHSLEANNNYSSVSRQFTHLTT